VSVTFSHTFISHVRLLYDFALDQLASGKTTRDGINCYTDFAGPAYVSAVAAIEAFTNEVLFGSIAKYVLKESTLWALDQRWVERLEILNKLIIVPHLLFNKSFERNSQPYQDLTLLVKVRNDFVHYKMDEKIPSYVKPLEDRGIALPAASEFGDYAWVHKLSTSEGIRWANNTVCRVANALIGFIPEEYKQVMFASLLQNFVEIPEDFARDRVRKIETSPKNGESKK